MPPKIVLSEEEIHAVIESYKQLGSLSKVCAKFGLCRAVIRRTLVGRTPINHRGSNWKYASDEDFFSRDTPEAFYWAGFLAT